MRMQFKAILSNKNLYQEVLLPVEALSVTAGTTPNVEVRLPKSSFFEPFDLRFVNEGDVWTVLCSQNIYMSDGTMSKLPQKQLKHGDELSVRYDSTDVELMTMSVMIDFDEVDQDFSRGIDIHDRSQVVIGSGSQCDVQIKNRESQNDVVRLVRQGDGYVLQEKNTLLGVYVNGARINKKEVLKNYDFFALDKYKFFIKDGWLYTTKSNEICVNGLSQKLDLPSQGSLEYPKFNRNTRLKIKPCEDEITVLDPPEPPAKPSDNLAMTLLPSIAMLVVTVFLRSVMSSGGGSFVLLSACTMGIGIITSVITYKSNKKKYKKDMEERQQKYDHYIQQKREKVEKARAQEKEELNEIYYSSEREKKNVEEFSGTLFDRTLEDEDFATVCLGKGSRKSLRQLQYKEQEKIEIVDEMVLIPEQMHKEYKNLSDAPITLALAEHDAVGIVGDLNHCMQLLKVLTLDLVTRHYYSDLNLYYIADERHMKDLRWVRWLPYVNNEAGSIRNIACDGASRNLIFENLFVQMSAEKDKNRDKDKKTKRTVIFVLDDMGIKNHPVSEYIQGCKDKGFTFVFFDRCEEQLPQNCGALIQLDKEQNSAELLYTDDSRQKEKFTYPLLSDSLMEKVALKLAPVYCDEVSLESSLTKSYSFFQMMNIGSAEDIDLGQNWASANIEKTMQAPLGINAKKEIVSLDLYEKAHGPHGLVAGTTGSGKSEILQSYILSMAIHYHPYEVGFVIIDFKGGGMANQFVNLPHLIGTITNIDGREIDRSLKSIKAELQKRQRLFAENKVHKIDAYIKKFKQGEVKIPLPHLIIIVDEFAELKANQPEFMKELISTARIGRSLGVHLILATQKPSGQVSDEIWSNSKFKLCLKVQNQEDSKEVLKSPLAAEIREPGRAYLQVGNNEIFELFQSAYSGCAARNDDVGNDREFSLQELNLWGKATTIYHHAKKKEKNEDKVDSQLDVIVSYVNDFCRKEHIQKLSNICLPALKSCITYQPAKQKYEEMQVDIGMYDDPDNQYQGPVTLNFASQNTLIIGSAQNGKTTLLQTIIRGIEDTYTPAEVNMYILDFGSKALKNFEGSHHIGGVVCAQEDERIKNLFRLLDSFVEERKNKLAALGVSSFASYLEAGYTDLPQIVLIVDNFAALKELYLSDEDPLLGICRDGLTVGISVIMTNPQTNTIGFRYMSNFAQKFALSCNDSSEYSTLLDRCHMTPANFPGRGLFEKDKVIYEFQTYLPFEGEKEIERVTAIQSYCKQINAKYPNSKATAIPEVPSVLNYAFAAENMPKAMEKPYLVPTGIDYDTVQWVGLDLLKTQMIAVTGREKFGKTNYTQLIMEYLQRNVFDYPATAYIFDDYDRQLQKFETFGFVEKYTIDCTELEFVLNEMEEVLKERLAAIRAGESIDDEPLLLCILQSSDLMAPDGMKKSIADNIRRMIKTYGRLKLCFVLASVPDVAVNFSAPEGLKLAKEAQTVLCMDDLNALKLVDVPIAEVRKFKKKIELGDAYLITEQGICKQKVIHGE